MKDYFLTSFRTIAIAGVALGLAGVSCGEDAPAGPGPIPIDSYREEYKGALCDYQTRCGLMPDKATCLQVDRTDDALLQLIADVGFGKVTYDPTAGRACVEATRNRPCQQLLSVRAQVEAACKGVFQGSIAEGGACLVDGECVGESFCDTSMCMGGSCCEGVCTKVPGKVPIGGDCSVNSCVDDAFCNSSGGMGGGGGSGTSICEARANNGEPCDDSLGCKDGQRCDVNGAGKCYILSGDGQPCNPTLNVACVSFNKWCDPAESKCSTLPGNSEPCTPDGDCLGYAYCDNGTCRTRPVENGACPMNSPECLGSLRCDTDVCVALPPAQVCAPN